MVFFVLFSMQSLVDIARKEAERRKQLEQQGIEGKVFEGNPVPSNPDVNVTVWTDPPPAAGTQKTSARNDSSKKKESARSFRKALQKLDRLIKQHKDRLKSRRARLQSARWSIATTGRTAGRGKAANSQSKLQEEIEELEIKLKSLRRERAEIYEEGRKEGFLPGELDGHGIMP